MKILLVGNGGREHALLWRLAADRPDAEFFITRGNPGTDALARSIDVAPTDVAAVSAAVHELAIDLTVVGPEVPLAGGLADSLAAGGKAVFGPLARAARIETSKAFAKELMRSAGVPTAAFETFTDLKRALDYVEAGPEGCVIKADGLAAGKGALVCRSRSEARLALRQMLEERVFGAAGETVVIEELMQGEELSFLALTDGKNILPLVASQDHKAVGEGDRGPNTGGMGAYAPVSLAAGELSDQVVRTILEPVVEELTRRGSPYRGCLYAGLMLTLEGPRVVEFNCRFGDPETQVVLPLLDGDLMELMLAAAHGSLEGCRAALRPGAAVCVVLASGGYPGSYEKGKAITFGPELEQREDLIVFHAGTARRGADVVTAGGRALGVTGLGRDIRAAVQAAYEGVDAISFEGLYCRRDIAYREIYRLQALQDSEID